MYMHCRVTQSWQEKITWLDDEVRALSGKTRRSKNNWTSLLGRSITSSECDRQGVATGLEARQK